MQQPSETGSPVVLITGALTGIGRATALAFARAGARVVVSGRRDEAGAALAAELSALGTEAAFVRADVRHEDDVRALIDATVARFARLDVAVNNAGFEGTGGPITAQSPETYAATFDTNVLGVLLSLKHELRVMQPQGRGSIINISSIAGSRGVPNASVYTASKHAVEGLTKSAALEAASFGVRVNAIAPGPIETGMLDRFYTPDRKAAAIAAAPLKRVGSPDEIAQAIRFLASDASSYVIGQIIGVDGGKSAYMLLLLWRPLAAAVAFIVLISSSTSTSAVFVAYRTQWGLSAGDIGIVFSTYVGSLIPVLLVVGALADRFGRLRVIVAGMLFMLAGTVALVLAHALPLLLVARLFQGVGAGLAGGSLSSLFAESYRGRFAATSVLQAVSAIGLFVGPVITAIAFDLGGGTNRSYLPMLILGIAILALAPLLAETPSAANAPITDETPFSDTVVRRAMRFALPIAFVSWASLSLYLALVPAYLATALHAHDPLIGAAAVVAAQLASIVASLRLGHIAPEPRGIIAPIVMIAGLTLLVAGTSTNAWPLIAVATLLVGAGGGVASSAAFAIAGRVGRGQRTRIFAQLFVASYLGYSLPALATGLIAAHWSLTIGFAVVIVVLAAVSAVIPLLRPKVCEECPPPLVLQTAA